MTLPSVRLIDGHPTVLAGFCLCLSKVKGQRVSRSTRYDREVMLTVNLTFVQTVQFALAKYVSAVDAGKAVSVVVLLLLMIVSRFSWYCENCQEKTWLDQEVDWK